MFRLSARATVLGSILIPINCYWLIISRQPYQYQPIPTIISPFFNVIFILLLLVIFNRVLARFSPRSILTREELIIIYVMLSVASAIQSFQMMQTLTTMMEVPFRRATVENDWKNLFGKYIPNWLSVSNKKSVMAYYQGDSTFYHWPHIVSMVHACPVVVRFYNCFGLCDALYYLVCPCKLGRKRTIILPNYPIAPCNESSN